MVVSLDSLLSGDRLVFEDYFDIGDEVVNAFAHLTVQTLVTLQFIVQQHGVLALMAMLVQFGLNGLQFEGHSSLTLDPS